MPRLPFARVERWILSGAEEQAVDEVVGVADVWTLGQRQAGPQIIWRQRIVVVLRRDLESHDLARVEHRSHGGLLVVVEEIVEGGHPELPAASA